jgi:hypothetical protein
VHTIPSGHDCDEPQPAWQFWPSHRKPTGHWPEAPEQGVPVWPPVAAVQVPASEQIWPLPQPAAGVQSAVQAPLAQ